MEANTSRDVVNSMFQLKRSINDIIRNRLYIKDFSGKLMEYMCEVDDVISLFTVEILLKTDFYKCLKPILGLSDMYSALKAMCVKVLTSIMDKVKTELFENKDFIMEISEFPKISKFKNYGDKLFKELEKLNFGKNNTKIKNNFEANEDDNIMDDSVIKTDLKYLNSVKRIELGMFLESKRRSKTKRMEGKDLDICENADKCESMEIELDGKGIENNCVMGTKENKLNKNNSFNTFTNQHSHCNENSTKELVDNLISISLLDNENNKENIIESDYSKYSNNIKIDLENFKYNDPENLNNLNTKFIGQKMLRSSRYSKNKLEQCYDMYSKSDSVNKPIKNNKKNIHKKKKSISINNEENGIESFDIIPLLKFNDDTITDSSLENKDN